MANGTTYDAVIVGAGHNGLVTALYLAKAGWSTLVLERNSEIGGAVRSGEVTRPGFVHDLYSTNQNLFVASPVYREFKEDLQRHGLEYVISERPYSNVFPDGKSLRVYKDAERTLDLIREHSAEDARGWSRLYDRYTTFSKTLLPLYNTPMPSAEVGVIFTQAVREAGLEDLNEILQMLMASIRELATTTFTSRELQALFATWGMHLDFGPDVAAGTMFPLLSTFSSMENGIALAKGGGQRMVEALAGLLREHGGEVRTESEVARILTEGQRVTGVELVSGEQIAARKAVVANLTPTVLYDLLDPDAFPEPFRRKVKDYVYGPGTMMIHVALSGKLPWAAGEELAEFTYVHIPPYLETLAQTYTQAVNGYLPDDPLLIVGQPVPTDPSRAPEGGQILWIQVRALPAPIRGDAVGEIAARTWDEAAEPYADRVMAKLEQYAPGAGDLVLERTVFSPAYLERDNPNLVGGDSISGSHHIRQNFLWRPFPNWSNYAMPLEGLYEVGAGTWPGAGTNAASGAMAAQRILNPHPVRDTLIKGGAVAGTALAGGALLAYLLGGKEAE